MMKRLLALILVLSTLATLSGCKPTGEDSGKTALCIVIGNSANSQGLNLGSPLVQDTVLDTIRGYGFVSLVRCDGNPTLLAADSYDIPDQYKSASPQRLEMDTRSKASALLGLAQSVVAQVPEVDYMAALQLAVRSLATLEGYDEKKILVVGTGLSTTGVLNFRNNILSAAPADVAEMLAQRQEIPDFRSITVYWQQLGDVAPPQQSLSAAQRQSLQEIYRQIVEAGGGRFVCNSMIPAPVNTQTSYPAVTPVELPSVEPIRFQNTVPQETVPEESPFSQPIVLTEKQVQFVGDEAVYLHPAQAVEELKPIAQALAQSSISVLLVGTTAGDETTPYALELSQARADTVKQTLCGMGIAGERIVTLGLGSSDPWHIGGLSTADPASSMNRKVVVLDLASDTARQLLGSE